MEIVGEYIEGDKKLTYKCSSGFKSFHCLWNPDIKKWKVPYDTRNLNNLNAFISQMNQEYETEQEVDAQRMKDLWKQASDNLNIKFAKKGSPEYEQVKTEFKKLLA